MSKPIKVLLQYLLPHHIISRVAARFMNTRIVFIKNKVITWFVKRYQVDLSLAKTENINDFATFNGFFTRQLKSELRPIDTQPSAVICPVDGYVSTLGQVSNETLLQAKGIDYSLATLLADNDYLQKRFSQSYYATFYLSPRDYHCVHMPFDGVLKRTIYVPGRLFSVNLLTANHVPGLFTRNERLICEFETSEGPMLVIFVGAMIVAGIYTVWGGQEAPCAGKTVQEKVFDDGVFYKKGDKIGHFNVGSTIIFMMKTEHLSWKVKNESHVCFGAGLGEL